MADRRIVLLGKAEAKKHRLVRILLGDTKHNEECEECTVYEGQQAGRKVCIVDTPGWDRISTECTSPKIKNEITRSVTLCAPGPHALILVFPLKPGDVPSANELESAYQHMELLSETVWNYTMVLFLCDGDVEESTIKDHIQNAEKLLQKCRGRHYVVRRRSFETELSEFLKEIDSMVDENIRDSKVKESGGFFLPEVHYDTMQRKMPQKQKGEDKSDEKYGIWQRRESYQLINPT
ncbi:GTPase IMAP family member 4-like, partial [Clarias magur]